MLVEHVFVTTYDEQETVRLATWLLDGLGFLVTSEAGGDVRGHAPD